MMMHDGFPVAAWAAAHLAALTVAVLSRLALSSRAQGTMRVALALGMLLVAGIALTTDFTDSLAWVGSSATLGLMVVAAVWEPIRQPHDPVLVRLLAAHD